MQPAGSVPAIPENERPPTQASDLAATRKIPALISPQISEFLQKLYLYCFKKITM